jgi:hypothetical protein
MRHLHSSKDVMFVRDLVSLIDRLQVVESFFADIFANQGQIPLSIPFYPMDQSPRHPRFAFQVVAKILLSSYSESNASASEPARESLNIVLILLCCSG